MKYSTQIKPISYLKANAAEVLAKLAAGGEPLIITQNGEAKAVLQSVEDYEKTEETLALMQLLAISRNEIANSNVFDARDTVKELRKKLIE